MTEADALYLLSNRFEHDGFPMPAMHCLQGLLSLKLLPEQEVRARCRLGSLLLRHTRNLRQAKTHLHLAVGRGRD